MHLPTTPNGETCGLQTANPAPPYASPSSRSCGPTSSAQHLPANIPKSLHGGQHALIMPLGIPFHLTGRHCLGLAHCRRICHVHWRSGTQNTASHNDFLSSSFDSILVWTNSSANGCRHDLHSTRAPQKGPQLGHFLGRSALRQHSRLWCHCDAKASSQLKGRWADTNER